MYEVPATDQFGWLRLELVFLDLLAFLPLVLWGTQPEKGWTEVRVRNHRCPAGL